MVLVSPVPVSRDQHIVDAQKEFGGYERRKGMTLLRKALRLRYEMGLAQVQWQSSDQNPHCLTSHQAHFKQSWFHAFPECDSWVHWGFLVPLGMS